MCVCVCLQLIVSIVTHKQNLPELVQAVKFVAMKTASREALTEAWKAWMQTAGKPSHIPLPSIPPDSTRVAEMGLDLFDQL